MSRSPKAAPTLKATLPTPATLVTSVNRPSPSFRKSRFGPSLVQVEVFVSVVQTFEHQVLDHHALPLDRDDFLECRVQLLETVLFGEWDDGLAYCLPCAVKAQCQVDSWIALRTAQHFRRQADSRNENTAFGVCEASR